MGSCASHQLPIVSLTPQHGPCMIILPLLLQAAQALHQQLRRQDFALYESNLRMLPREFTPRELHADVTSTSPAKDAIADSGGAGRARARASRPGSGRAGGRGRGGTRAARGASAPAVAAADAPPEAHAAAPSPRSWWRGPAKARARSERPAAPKLPPCTAQEVDAAEQVPTVKAAPMSLKERIAANASRSVPVTVTTAELADGPQGEHALPDVDRGAAHKDAAVPNPADDVAVHDIAAAVDVSYAEVEDDQMPAPFTDSDPVQASISWHFLQAFLQDQCMLPNMTSTTMCWG